MLGVDEGSSLGSTSRQEAIGMEIGKLWSMDQEMGLL
jgi:hypothetical protein